MLDMKWGLSETSEKARSGAVGFDFGSYRGNNDFRGVEQIEDSWHSSNTGRSKDSICLGSYHALYFSAIY